MCCFFFHQAAEQAEILIRERPDILGNLQNTLIPAVLIVAMFMGCTVRTCIQNRCPAERRLTVFRRHRICKIFPVKI